MKKYFSTGISQEFTYSPLFPWKNQSSLFEKLVASASFKKRQMFCPLPTCNSLYFEQIYTNQNIITFCIKSCYILHYRRYYILHRKLLHFVLLLHFVVKVITFCVTITFCVSGVTGGKGLKSQMFQVKVTIPENFRARGFTQKAFYGEVLCSLEEHK